MKKLVTIILLLVVPDNHQWWLTCCSWLAVRSSPDSEWCHTSCSDSHWRSSSTSRHGWSRWTGGCPSSPPAWPPPLSWPPPCWQCSQLRAPHQQLSYPPLTSPGARCTRSRSLSGCTGRTRSGTRSWTWSKTKGTWSSQTPQIHIFSMTRYAGQKTAVLLRKVVAALARREMF